MGNNLGNHHKKENRHEKLKQDEEFHKGDELEHHGEKWRCKKDHKFDEDNYDEAYGEANWERIE